jgi:hypothetical protein
MAARVAGFELIFMNGKEAKTVEFSCRRHKVCKCERHFINQSSNSVRPFLVHRCPLLSLLTRRIQDLGQVFSGAAQGHFSGVDMRTARHDNGSGVARMRPTTKPPWEKDRRRLVQAAAVEKGARKQPTPIW